MKLLLAAVVGAVPKFWAMAQETTKFAVLLGGSCAEAVQIRNVAPVLTAPLGFTPVMAFTVHRSRNSSLAMSLFSSHLGIPTLQTCTGTY